LRSAADCAVFSQGTRWHRPNQCGRAGVYLRFVRPPFAWRRANGTFKEIVMTTMNRFACAICLGGSLLAAATLPAAAGALPTSVATLRSADAGDVTQVRWGGHGGWHGGWHGGRGGFFPGAVIGGLAAGIIGSAAYGAYDPYYYGGYYGGGYYPSYAYYGAPYYYGRPYRPYYAYAYPYRRHYWHRRWHHW
jgi:hypothetical protein